MLNEENLRRYSRNIILPEIGKAGQEKLQQAKVLVIGAGGLGSPALLYLASSGVGTIGIIDSDKVELSNLQRQIIHESGDIGRAKVDSAEDALTDLNPEIKIEKHFVRLNENNVRDIIKKYDVVIDGSDNIATRFLANDVCFELKKTLVSAAILRFEGQISVFKAYEGGDNPCYRCLYPEAPPADSMPSCSENGILAPVAGMLGAMQAAEAIKELLGIGESLSGHLVIFDILKSNIRKVRIIKEKACRICASEIQKKYK